MTTDKKTSMTGEERAAKFERVAKQLFSEIEERMLVELPDTEKRVSGFLLVLVDAVHVDDGRSGGSDVAYRVIGTLAPDFAMRCLAEAVPSSIKTH